MKLLIDTQLLLWAYEGSARLSEAAEALIGDRDRPVMFSPLYMAEIAIKQARGLAAFAFDADLIRAGALANGYTELPLTGHHAARLADLPPIHKDAFDRLMIAQALAESVPFVTADALLARYPGRVMVV